jgi:hypothetical protein
MIDNDDIGCKILDPSGGKGDILDYIERKYEKLYTYRRCENLFTIEIEPELQAILRSKGFNVIDNDFLTYKCETHFPLIVMNPPFEHGEKHFLKAWEIASDTKISCLLNETAIKNPNTQERKLLAKIIEDNDGTIEYLGNCFSTAQRKTNVNVVLIKIYKKETSEFEYDFDKHFDQEKQYNMDDINNKEVENIDVFGNLENRYNSMRKMYLDYVHLQKKLLQCASGLVDVKVLSSNAKNGFGVDCKSSINSLRGGNQMIDLKLVEK